jgi:hypothetical protein
VSLLKQLMAQKLPLSEMAARVGRTSASLGFPCQNHSHN